MAVDPLRPVDARAPRDVAGANASRDVRPTVDATTDRPESVAPLDVFSPSGRAAVENTALGDTILPDPFELTRSLEDMLAHIERDAEAPDEIREVAAAVLNDEVTRILGYFGRRSE